MSDPEHELYRRIVDLDEECQKEAASRLAALLWENEGKGVSLGVALRRAYWHIPEVPCRWLRDATGGDGRLEQVVLFESQDLDCRVCRANIPIIARDRADRDRLWQMGFTCPACTSKIDDEKFARYREQERRIEEGALIKAKRIAELCAMPYDDYLQSDHWQAIRLKALERDKERCRVCGATERLHVHHSTYERRGCERLDDLLTLCADCHQLFHEHRDLARPR